MSRHTSSLSGTKRDDCDEDAGALVPYGRPRPSQMQVTIREPHDVVIHQPGSSRRASQHHGRPSQLYRPTRVPDRAQYAPTRRVDDRPQVGKSQLVRPGEPHHFGSHVERGEIFCTLCRCSNPNSHSDAYTMLNAPRGKDINGKPIDWQEAKRKMLDYHGKDQISHAEEIEAVPFVFEAQTAKTVLDIENDLRASARAGHGIVINTEGNTTNWHNENGHAKPHITERGARTQFTGS